MLVVLEKECSMMVVEEDTVLMEEEEKEVLKMECKMCL